MDSLMSGKDISSLSYWIGKYKYKKKKKKESERLKLRYAELEQLYSLQYVVSQITNLDTSFYISSDSTSIYDLIEFIDNIIDTFERGEMYPVSDEINYFSGRIYKRIKKEKDLDYLDLLYDVLNSNTEHNISNFLEVIRSHKNELI